MRQCKYLGVILSDDGGIGHDIDRAMNAFLKQFYATYGKFKFCDRNVLCYLFRTYTSSFYGIELWVDKIKRFQMDKISSSQKCGRFRIFFVVLKFNLYGPFHMDITLKIKRFNLIDKGRMVK